MFLIYRLFIKPIIELNVETSKNKIISFINKLLDKSIILDNKSLNIEIWVS